MKCADVYNVFFDPGEVVEIRAFGLSKSNPAWEGWAGGAGVVYGYFDNAVDFGKCAEALDKAKARGIYFTLNPVNPDILARAVNRLKAADMKTNTTQDKEILCLRWLPIDIDAKYPHELKVSASKEEVKETIAVRKKIWAWLKDKQGFGDCIPAMSGNGGHILYRLPDIPNSEDNILMIKNILAVLAIKFNSKKVDIDRSVFNPARIWRLYGTTSRKGDHTEDRPHRRSYIEPKFLTSLGINND